MNSDPPRSNPIELVTFVIGMYLIPHWIGYWIVGVCLFFDVIRWGVLLAEWLGRRRERYNDSSPPRR